MSSSADQRRRLRHEGRSLRPAVVVGSAGLSDGVVAQVDEQLRRRELVKVKMPPGPDRKALPGVLAERLGAELISLVGRSAVLWRANPDADAPVGETD